MSDTNMKCCKAGTRWMTLQRYAQSVTILQRERDSVSCSTMLLIYLRPDQNPSSPFTLRPEDVKHSRTRTPKRWSSKGCWETRGKSFLHKRTDWAFQNYAYEDNTGWATIFTWCCSFYSQRYIKPNVVRRNQELDRIYKIKLHRLGRLMSAAESLTQETDEEIRDEKVFNEKLEDFHFRSYDAVDPKERL